MNIFSSILLYFLMVSFSFTQFEGVEVTLDLRNIRENYHDTFRDLKDKIIKYYESTIFSVEDLDLEIPLTIHVIGESVSTKNNKQIISSQIFFSNQRHLKQYSKSCQFPFSKGTDIRFDSHSDLLGSILDFYGYIFIANELDLYSILDGESFYNESEKISNQAKNSAFTKGWESRWRKIKEMRENIYLRTAKYHYLEAVYSQDTDTTKQYITEQLESFAKNIQLSNEFFGNDRNTVLYLDTISKELAKMLYLYRMYDTLAFFSMYDPDNKDVYKQYLK